MMPSAATVELVEILDKAGPFGAGSPAPRFAFADVMITFAKQVGQNHLKVRFGDGLAHKSTLLPLTHSTAPRSGHFKS